MGKYRMCEPWGYQESDEYLSKKTQLENELEENKQNDVKEFASVEYDSDIRAFVFKNVKGEPQGYAYMSDIIPSDLIESVEYDQETKDLVITFKGGEIVNIPLDDLIDVEEAGDGLELDGNKFVIKIDENSELFLSVSEDGLKLSGVQSAIDTEKDRAEGVETEINDKLDLKADKTEIPTKVSELENDAHYLTEHQSLDEYAKTSDVNASLALKADKTEIPTDFYTQEDVNRMVSQLLTRIENLEENNGVVVADDAAAVQNAAANSNIVLTSSEAIQALTSNTEFNTLTIVGGNSNNDIKAVASDKVTVDGMTINGDKGASNGRMQISADTVTIKNVIVETGSTAYNLFESSQNTAKTEYFTSNYDISNITCDNTELNHNLFSIYTFADNAVINVSDSNFNLDVDNSNVLRLSNYTNATGVTVNFENVDWTYENAEGSDWSWAGLIIYQPSSSDTALTGGTTAIETWHFNFKNCRYNGEKVTENNFGEHNQVAYLYNINKSGEVSDASTVITMSFE